LDSSSSPSSSSSASKAVRSSRDGSAPCSAWDSGKATVPPGIGCGLRYLERRSMCGIAGYSLDAAAVDRTLAAQALLAAIAERGADAVGYAYRSPGSPYPTVVKQRTPASRLLDRVAVPADAAQALVHVRDYTKGHPSIAANNHPVRHGPVVGIHNGIIVNDDE